MINKEFAAAFFPPGIEYHIEGLSAVIRMMGKASLLESHAQWMELEASLRNIADTINKQLGINND